MANKLSDTSKSLLRELEQSDLRAQTVKNATSSAAQQKMATKAADIKSFFDLLEKASKVINNDCVDEYFSQITTNNKIATGAKIFNEELFNKDYAEFKDKYNSLASWLKENIPQNMLAMSDINCWQTKHLELLKMKSQQPNKDNQKYYSDEFETIPLSGTAALNIVRNLKATFDAELENTLQQFINEDRLQFKDVHFSDKEWEFLRMAAKFGMTDSTEFRTRISSFHITAHTFDIAIQFNTFQDFLNDREQRTRTSKRKVSTSFVDVRDKQNPNDAEFVTKSRLLNTLNTRENNLALKLIVQYANSFYEYLKFKSTATKDIQLL